MCGQKSLAKWWIFPVLGWLALTGFGWGQSSSGWLTGAALRRKLEEPTVVMWADVPIAQAMQRLSQTQQVAILLDRAVDPQRRLRLSVAGPVRVVIEQAVDYYNRVHCQQESYPRPAVKLGVAFLPWGVYVGPKPLARGLNTVLERRRTEVLQAPPALRQKLLRKKRWQWEDLTSPQQLLQALAQEAQVQLVHLDQLPHDLWRGGSWPAMPWYARVSLVLVQFEATFDLRAPDQVVLRRLLPEEGAVLKRYPAGPRAQEKLAQWKKLCPRAQIRLEGSHLIVRATVEEHRLLVQGGRKPRVRRRPGQKVYTLRVHNQPLEQVIPQLAQRLQLQLHWNPVALRRAGVPLGELVTLHVQQATREELFAALLAPWGLEFEIQGNQLVVRAGKRGRESAKATSLP